ncbi:MAG: hypothetical protein J6W16_04625, partial [Methanobrevibacter sp.]|nr:hypothetical protein [Methanobrevibacter sp.]
VVDGKLYVDRRMEEYMDLCKVMYENGYAAQILQTDAVRTAGIKGTLMDENGKPVECNEIDFAHHAWWSDLGERYLADKEYEPGTLVKFGGTKEITIADDEVNAIVSTKAFDLNAGLKDGTVIALCGRVPTKVKGKI